MHRAGPGGPGRRARSARPASWSEFIFVQRGRVIVEVGFETYELNAGDALNFPGISPHRVAAQGGERAEILCVILRDRHG
ncbi:cupin domain-containing protein [Saccharopolyspora sp. NPDC002376]